MRTSPRSSPPVCPVCGADVPPRANNCPECGADEETGWDTDANTYDGVDLPDDDDFDYDEFLEQEGFVKSARPKNIGVVYWLAGIVLLAVLLILASFGLL